MRNSSIILLFILALLTTSCSLLLVDESIEKQITFLEQKENGRKIYFLPMVHIGTEEYYESVRDSIENLRRENYIVYYENVTIDTSLIDSVTLDTIYRKLRKVLGIHIIEGYKNKENKSLPRLAKRKKYIEQDYDFLKVGNEYGDLLVDLNLIELVDKYEKNRGEIKLTDCDFNTDLYEKYNCKGKKEENKFYFQQVLRNDYIIERVLSSEDRKIIMLYGKAHANWIIADLKSNGFHLIKKGKYIYLSLDK